MHTISVYARLLSYASGEGGVVLQLAPSLCLTTSVTLLYDKQNPRQLGLDLLV